MTKAKARQRAKANAAQKARKREANADPALYRDEGDSANLAALQKKELGQVEKDLSAAEDRWAEAQETWDAASS